MGEKWLPAGSQGRTAAWNETTKEREFRHTQTQALDTKARAKIKTVANSTQPATRKKEAFVSQRARGKYSY